MARDAMGNVHVPPAGCRCALAPSSEACPKCTCPDCGGFGRYGVPAIHAESCNVRAS